MTAYLAVRDRPAPSIPHLGKFGMSGGGGKPFRRLTIFDNTELSAVGTVIEPSDRPGPLDQSFVQQGLLGR